MRLLLKKLMKNKTKLTLLPIFQIAINQIRIRLAAVIVPLIAAIAPRAAVALTNVKYFQTRSQ